jgi:hypothetical protein
MTAATTYPRDGLADAIRARLTDPRIVETLGLADGATWARGAVTMRCPSPGNEDRHPSCSVRVGPRGTIVALCDACGAGGDVLWVVACAHGLEVRADYRRVLELGAQLAGLAKPERRFRVLLVELAVGLPVLVDPPDAPLVTIPSGLCGGRHALSCRALRSSPSPARFAQIRAGNPIRSPLPRSRRLCRSP